MALTEKQIVAELKQGKFSPVYLLMGEENYFIDLLSNYFEEHVIAEEFRDFDQQVVYGHDVEMLDVINLAMQCPLISPYRLLLVKEAQGIRKEQWEQLLPYLEHPSSSTILVFCYRHKKFDKRQKVYKQINAKGVVYEHNKLRDEDVPTWILSQVNSAGYNITQKGALLLTEYLGNDLAKISNELGKLYVDLNLGDTITEDLMERNIGISKDYNVFELQKAIGAKDALRCNQIIHYFAQNPKENPIQMVLPLLYKYFVTVMIYLQNSDKPGNELASIMGCSSYFIKDYAAAARNYTLGRLATCIDYLAEADLRSKGVRNSGSVDDGEILKELVFKCIH